jgi:dolichol-phosphate mannosyltransferase
MAIALEAESVMNLNRQEPQISIVVPVYNEEENVLPLADEIHRAMEQVSKSYELVFVDDCSTDSTWEKIADARRSNSRVRGLRHQQNAGQSAALWTGIQSTQAPILATMDGDRQNDPADLPLLFAELKENDFVCGVRRKRQDNWLRLVSTKVARAARRQALKVDFCDTGCAFRVFKRTALDGIFPFNGLHRFLPVLVHGNGARTKEIPIGHRARVAGVSKYGLWNRLGRGIYDLIAIAWYQKRRLSRIATSELPLSTSEQETREPLAVRTPSPELHPVERA